MASRSHTYFQPVEGLGDVTFWDYTAAPLPSIKVGDNMRHDTDHRTTDWSMNDARAQTFPLRFRNVDVIPKLNVDNIGRAYAPYASVNLTNLQSLGLLPKSPYSYPDVDPVYGRPKCLSVKFDNAAASHTYFSNHLLPNIDYAFRIRDLITRSGHLQSPPHRPDEYYYTLDIDKARTALPVIEQDMAHTRWHRITMFAQEEALGIASYVWGPVDELASLGRRDFNPPPSLGTVVFTYVPPDLFTDENISLEALWNNGNPFSIAHHTDSWALATHYNCLQHRARHTILYTGKHVLVGVLNEEYSRISFTPPILVDRHKRSNTDTDTNIIQICAQVLADAKSLYPNPTPDDAKHSSMDFPATNIRDLPENVTGLAPEIPHDKPSDLNTRSRTERKKIQDRVRRKAMLSQKLHSPRATRASPYPLGDDRSIARSKGTSSGRARSLASSTGSPINNMPGRRVRMSSLDRRDPMGNEKPIRHPPLNAPIVPHEPIVTKLSFNSVQQQVHGGGSITTSSMVPDDYQAPDMDSGITSLRTPAAVAYVRAAAAARYATRYAAHCAALGIPAAAATYAHATAIAHSTTLDSDDDVKEGDDIQYMRHGDANFYRQARLALGAEPEANLDCAVTLTPKHARRNIRFDEDNLEESRRHARMAKRGIPSLLGLGLITHVLETISKKRKSREEDENDDREEQQPDGQGHPSSKRTKREADDHLHPTPVIPLEPQRGLDRGHHASMIEHRGSGTQRSKPPRRGPGPTPGPAVKAGVERGEDEIVDDSPPGGWTRQRSSGPPLSCASSSVIGRLPLPGPLGPAHAAFTAAIASVRGLVVRCTAER